jgi:hypothetical protein
VLFEEGRRLATAGQPREACEKFQASQRLDPGIGTLLYLGDCYEKTGRTASAWAAFREASSWADAEGQQNRSRIAKVRAEALSSRLVTLRLDVAPENLTLDGFVLTRNGSAVPAPTFGIQVPVDPGDQVLSATAPGHLPYETTVAVTAVSKTVSIPPLSAAPVAAVPVAHARPVAQTSAYRVLGTTPGAPQAEHENGSFQRWAALAIGGVGVVGLGVGAVLGVVASNKNADSKAECRPEDPNRCTPAGVALREDAQQSATLSTVGFAVGGSLLAGGIILYLTSPRGHGSARDAVTLSADAAASGARVTLRGSL